MNTLLQNYGLVALGGALGAMARMGAGHLVTSFAGTRYPWHTFAINIVGSLCLGFIATALGARAGQHTAALNQLLAIGFLGAFTTFSTFELETWNLLHTGRPAIAIIYAVTSVLTGLVAVFGGIALARAAM